MEFNLITEPWIPCFSGRTKEVGLIDCIAEAHDIEAIADPSPLVTVSLYRLLLALSHRVYGPASDRAWKDIWDSGRFDVSPLEEYLNTWRTHFDLFDSAHPFLQDPSLDEYGEKGMSKPYLLKQELASGGNPLLFDHTIEESESEMGSGEAARVLLAYNNYSLEPRGAAGHYMESGLLSKGIVFLNKGANLFETLMLNLVIYDPEREKPLLTTTRDAPTWERDLSQPEERVPYGYLDWLTWRSRRLLLHAEESEAGIRVTHVTRTKGDSIPAELTDGDPAYLYDPMFAFKLNEKKDGADTPWEPLKVSAERGMWRDFYALFEAVNDSPKREVPKVIRFACELKADGFMDDRPLPVSAYSLSKDKAKVNFWREESFSLPLRYLEEDRLAYALQRSLSAVEFIGRYLGDALKALLKTSKPDLAYYWSDMEMEFRDYTLRLIHGESDPGEFLEKLRRIALDSFRRAAEKEGGSGEFIAEAVKEEKRLASRIAEVIKKNMEEQYG